MQELRALVPNPETVPHLQTEELAGKILLILRNRANPTTFLIGNELATLFPQRHSRYGEPITDPWATCSASLRGEVELSISEAWAWLTAQGLLVPAPNNTHGDWRVLSRRARTFESESSFADYAKSRLLPREILMRQLADRVWLAFVRGEYDSAVFQAFKAVEVAVREASQLGNDLIGTRLMRKAFDPKDGPLTDLSAEDGEREARSALFAGGIGSYKNPQSHRDVNLDDPAEAVELILFANHLLRLVDARLSSISASRS